MNLDGGVHQIPLEAVTGRLWVCGKHAIAPDPDSILTATGAGRVICLVQLHELVERYPMYVGWLETSGIATWLPMPDLDLGPFEQVAELVDSACDDLRRGTSIIVHCAAGIGRAGTLAASVCIGLGMDSISALDHVRRHRPGAGPEVGPQMDFVLRWEQECRRRQS